ncbi:MAG: hypothetical protein H0V62_11260 [Gammaproteobacteria bacterium]|nr:hypothetical protein [Gammaproteobacteria bacterium]
MKTAIMLIALHKQARTTPLIRAAIAGSDEPVSTLMQRDGGDRGQVAASRGGHPLR